MLWVWYIYRLFFLNSYFFAIYFWLHSYENNDEYSEKNALNYFTVFPSTGK